MGLLTSTLHYLPKKNCAASLLAIPFPSHLHNWPCPKLIWWHYNNSGKRQQNLLHALQLLLKHFLFGQSNLEKKEQSWRYHAPWLETILQSYSNQNTVVWHKNRHIDQCNRIESPKIIAHTYDQVIYDKRGRNIQREKTVSSTSGAGKTGQPYI